MGLVLLSCLVYAYLFYAVFQFLYVIYEPSLSTSDINVNANTFENMYKVAIKYKNEKRKKLNNEGKNSNMLFVFKNAQNTSGILKNSDLFQRHIEV